MEKPEELEKKPISSIVPLDWFKFPDSSSVWVTVYTAPSVSKEDMQAVSKAIDFIDVRVRAILCSGKLGYLDAKGLKHEILGPTSGRFHPESVVWRETPDGTYFMCLTPCVVDGLPRDELEMRSDISVAVGLFVSFLGKRVAFEHSYDNEVNIATGETTVVSPPLEDPWWGGFGNLDLSHSRFLSLSEAVSKLGRLPEATRTRVHLSLRWFEMAVRDTGVDAYLKFWIALETLAIQTTNINPLHDALAAAYNVSSQKVKQLFRIGRLFDLRGRIVHHGYIDWSFPRSAIGTG
jgi:hypothetical protein